MNSQRIKAGAVLYADFTLHGGRHFGVVVAHDGDRVVAARGTSYRPWENGPGSKWLPTSFLVDEDEVAGTGLHHGTRFDFGALQSFEVKDISIRGRVQKTHDVMARWDAARSGRAMRP